MDKFSPWSQLCNKWKCQFRGNEKRFELCFLLRLHHLGAVSWQDQRFFNERKTSTNKKGWIKCVTKWREDQLPAQLKNQ